MSLQKREEMLQQEYKTTIRVEMWNKLRKAEETFEYPRTDAYWKRQNEIDDWAELERYKLFIKYKVKAPYTLEALVKVYEEGTQEARDNYENMMREL